MRVLSATLILSFLNLILFELVATDIEKEFEKLPLISIHESMIKEIQLSKGKIDQIYYCPHLASEFCSCRKPRTGMIKKALMDFPSIDFSKSFLVGDSDTDIELAKAMKIEPIKVDTSYTLDIWCRNFFNL